MDLDGMNRRSTEGPHPLACLKFQSLLNSVLLRASVFADIEVCNEIQWTHWSRIASEGDDGEEVRQFDILSPPHTEERSVETALHGASRRTKSRRSKRREESRTYKCSVRRRRRPWTLIARSTFPTTRPFSIFHKMSHHSREHKSKHSKKRESGKNAEPEFYPEDYCDPREYAAKGNEMSEPRSDSKKVKSSRDKNRESGHRSKEQTTYISSSGRHSGSGKHSGSSGRTGNSSNPPLRSNTRWFCVSPPVQRR